MALRTPLSVTPHLYMGDSTGRPLDKGVVYFGEQDKDPEFYPISLFSDDALTKPLMQPVHTKGGYLYDKGDMVEPHAKELIYSVKVLDSYGRKVFYKGAMMRNSWNDDVIEQINTAIIGSADAARQVAIDITNDAINNTAVEGGVLADTFVVVDGSLSQRTINKGLESIADLSTINNPKDGLRVYVKSYHAGLGKGGGYFIYDSTRAAENDGGTVINGWVRELTGDITPYMFGAKGDSSTDDTQAFEKALAVGLPLFVPTGTYSVSNIVLKPYTTIYGSDRKSKIVGRTEGVALFSTEVDSSGKDIATRNIVMKDLYISGSNKSTHGILSRALISTTVTRVEFGEFTESCVTFGFGWNNNFTECKFVRSKNGVLTTKNGNNIINFLNCYFGSLNDIGLALSGGLTANTIGCTFELIEGVPIIIDSFNNVTMSGNYFEKNSTNGHQLSVESKLLGIYNSDSVTVYSDIILNGAGAWYVKDLKNVYPPTNINISGNSFSARGSDTRSVTIISANTALISNNRVHETGIDSGSPTGVQEVFVEVLYANDNVNTVYYNDIKLKDNNIGSTKSLTVRNVNSIPRQYRLPEIYDDTSSKENWFSEPVTSQFLTELPSRWSEGATIAISNKNLNNTDTIEVSGKAIGQFIIDFSKDEYKHLIGKIVKVSMDVLSLNPDGLTTNFYCEMSDRNTETINGNINRYVSARASNASNYSQNLSALYYIDSSEKVLRIMYYPEFSTSLSDAQKKTIKTYFYNFSLTEIGRTGVDGYLTINPSGTTAGRPSGQKAGYRYFDTTLGKPVFWTGAEWVDSSGVNV